MGEMFRSSIFLITMSLIFQKFAKNHHKHLKYIHTSVKEALNYEKQKIF